MSLRSRVLPVEEWDRLLALDPYSTEGLPDPNHFLITVVENEAGEILAHAAVFETIHWDVFRILPTYAANPSVARHLAIIGWQTLREVGAPSVHLTVSPDHPELVKMAEQLGFRPSPLRLYIRAIEEP